MKSAEEVLSEEFDNKGLGEPDRELTSKPYSAILSAMQTYANQSKWISVEDDLPKKPGKKDYEHVPCLVWVKGWGQRLLMWNCEHRVWDGEDGDDVSCDNDNVTHWQPLPEPPNK